MLTFNEYTTISNNCSDNKQLSDAINSVCSAALEESSVISHEIKNQAAYLKTCYQLLSSRNDELRSNKFWNNMGSTIDELVNYLERTSIYRYSFKQSETVSCTLSDIINNINEYIKSRYNGLIALDTSDISLECSSASIYASSHYLNIALKEIIDNAYEAASERNCNRPGLKSKLCKPFYTTHKGHTGLGLSIVNQICLLSGIDWNIISDNDVVTTVFAFNLQN